MNDPATPLEAYVLDVSYFSGKLEAYLRYKQIPHRRVEVGWRRLTQIALRETGVLKVPLLRTPSGEWLQDTTPMIDWLEERHPQGRVVPEDPVQAFFSRLLEDYADEWLWRPALHYRWSYPDGRHLHARRHLHVAEVHENRLCRLGPQIGNRLRVFLRPDVRLEHETKFAWLGELAAAVGAFLR